MGQPDFPWTRTSLRVHIPGSGTIAGRTMETCTFPLPDGRTGDVAEALMHEGYNCAQSVLVPHGPALGLDRATCLRLAAPFGGGMGRAGETCGALTGALMVLGLAHGVPSPLSEDKDRGYAPARQFIERFRQAHGSLLCRDLAGVDLSTPDGLQAFRDRGLHDNLCPRYVRTACRLLQDLLARPAKE